MARFRSTPRPPWAGRSQARASDAAKLRIAIRLPPPAPRSGRLTGSPATPGEADQVRDVPLPTLRGTTVALDCNGVGSRATNEQPCSMTRPAGDLDPGTRQP